MQEDQRKERSSRAWSWSRKGPENCFCLPGLLFSVFAHPYLFSFLVSFFHLASDYVCLVTGCWQMPLKATERDVYEFFSKAGKVSAFFYFILFSILILKYFNISYFVLLKILYISCVRLVVSFCQFCLHALIDM